MKIFTVSSPIHFDSEEHDNQLSKKYWLDNPLYFNSVNISTLAAMKIFSHAVKGGSTEVMGMLFGWISDGCFNVSDSFAIPVEGMETRVNTLEESNEYIVRYTTLFYSMNKRDLGEMNKISKGIKEEKHIKEDDKRMMEQVGGEIQPRRPESVIGWYHSHPSYGCWLSGIDIKTQRLYQQFQDPFVALVIDPVQSKLEEKICMMAFRVFDNYKHPGMSLEGPPRNLPHWKMKEFGVYANEYYELELRIPISPKEQELLEKVRNEIKLVNFLKPKKMKYNEITRLLNEVSDMIEDHLEKRNDQHQCRETPLDKRILKNKIELLTALTEKSLLELEIQKLLLEN